MTDFDLRKKIDSTLIIGELKELGNLRNIPLNQALDLSDAIQRLCDDLLVLFINFVCSRAGYANMDACYIRDTVDGEDQGEPQTDCIFVTDIEGLTRFSSVYRFRDHAKYPEQYWVTLVSGPKGSNKESIGTYRPIWPQDDGRLPIFERLSWINLSDYLGNFGIDPPEWDFFFIGANCEIMKVKIVGFSRGLFGKSHKTNVGGKEYEFRDEPPMKWLSMPFPESGHHSNQSRYCSYLAESLDPVHYRGTKPSKYLIIFLDKELLGASRDSLPKNPSVAYSDCESLPLSFGFDPKVQSDLLNSWSRIRDAIVRDFLSASGLSGRHPLKVGDWIADLKSRLRETQDAFDKGGPVADAIAGLSNVVEGGVNLIYELSGRSVSYNFRSKLNAIRGIIEEKDPTIWNSLDYAWNLRPYGAHYKSKRGKRDDVEILSLIAHKWVQIVDELANSIWGAEHKSGKVPDHNYRS